MTQHYYRPETRGFYRSDIHGDPQPNDVLLDPAQYDALQEQQTQGLVIEPRGRDLPQAVSPGSVSVLRLRELAYRQESDPLYLAAVYDGTPEALQAWRAKVEEIKNRYPKGTS